MTAFLRCSNQARRSLTTAMLAGAGALSLLLALGAAAPRALAQVAATAPVAAPAVAKASAGSVTTKKTGASTISSKPAWQDLTPVQQMSLKPLAARWNSMRETQKSKWLAIASSYPTLAPAEQEKLHSRMSEWVSLSQQQRAQARLNFAQSKQLTPSQKAETWKAYQELSPEEKQKLAKSGVPKPVGAAAAAKPVPPQKLAVVPVTRSSSAKATPKMPSASHALTHQTLLPSAQAASASASTQKN